MTYVFKVLKMSLTQGTKTSLQNIVFNIVVCRAYLKYSVDALILYNDPNLNYSASKYQPVK